MRCKGYRRCVQRRAWLGRGGQRDRRGDRTGRGRGRQGRDVDLLRELPGRERRLLQTLVHAQVVVRRDCRLASGLARSAPHSLPDERRVRTSFNPKWCGANSTPRTVPFASTSIARSTQRDALEGPGPPPLSCGPSVSPGAACSQILTVRSKEPEASTVPNSGCAQFTFEMEASCA